MSYSKEKAQQFVKTIKSPAIKPAAGVGRWLLLRLPESSIEAYKIHKKSITGSVESLLF